MWAKGAKETVMRLLLAICLSEVVPEVTDNALLTKIEQQIDGRPWCPTPYCWLRPIDEEVIKKHTEAFAQLHFDQTILAGAFEAIVTQHYSTAVALIECGIRVSQQQGVAGAPHHLKMRLDTFRILGLIICTRQSTLLSKNGEDLKVVSEEIQRNLVCLATIFSLL
jgi:hypothetical protein